MHAPGVDWLSHNGYAVWFPPNTHVTQDVQVCSLHVDYHAFDPGWKIARHALNCILQCTLGKNAQYEIKWVKRVGEGLSKEVYHADVRLLQQEEEQHLVFAVSLLLGDTDTEASSGMIHEFYVLDFVRHVNPSFSVPEPVGIVWCDGTLVSVRTFVYGLPLDLKTGANSRSRPWELIAQLAVEIHQLRPHTLPLSRKNHSTRQEHALTILENYTQSHIPEIHDAVQWVAEHIPPQDDASFLHGDLLGQNIYRTIHGGVWVLDWEYSCYGDPAYDLAIVTRGAKQPFKVSEGLEYLIDSYIAAGGKELTTRDVQVYEVFLILGWYTQALDPSVGGHAPEHYLQRLRGFLKRIR